MLDAAGLIEEAYDLEVSSPGLDRQLRKDRELRWAVGKRVRCWLAGGEEHHGRLVDVADERLTLDRRRQARGAAAGAGHEGAAGRGGSVATTAVRTMNRELIIVIEQLGREKGIDKEILFEALESALLSASRKSLPGDNMRIQIDRKTGEMRAYARRKVVTEVADPKLEISLDEAKALNPEAELDDELELEQERPPQDFGRIAAQTAKQVILQKVRDAEREGIYSEFAGKEGQILRGVVHRIEKRNVILEIGKAEAILPEREQIPGERYNPGDRIRAFVLEVRRSAKGPQITLSRTHPGYLARLFETEIPEIQEGIVRREGHGAGGGRAGQGGGRLHQARRRSDRRLRGAARHAHPGHQPRAARREDRHHRVVARSRHVRGARAVAGQGLVGDDRRGPRARASRPRW